MSSTKKKQTFVGQIERLHEFGGILNKHEEIIKHNGEGCNGKIKKKVENSANQLV